MKELLEVLNKWEAQYLVVGAHALGVYTEPRGTKDLDIWVNPTPENAKLVYSALKEFAAPLQGVTEAFFTEKDTFLVVGVAPNRFDILKALPGVEFNECWARRQSFDVGGVTANFPSLKDLLAAKIAAGRPQDLVDADKIRAALQVVRSTTDGISPQESLDDKPPIAKRRRKPKRKS
jgi:hypothetical protein